MCWRSIDIESYAQAQFRRFDGYRMTTADLARVVSAVPARYRDKVAGRILELRRGI